MPRGVREVKHTRVMFGDLGYTPGQNPYKPQGLRKMDDVWIDPDGDGYVSLLPGYTQLHDFSDSASTCLGMRFITGYADSGQYITYPVLMQWFSHSSTKLYWVSGSGAAIEAKEFTFSVGAGAQWAGKIPGYVFERDAFVFTSATGASNLGLKFYIGNPTDASEQFDIGLDRPTLGSAASALGTAGGAVKGVVKYFVS